MQYEYVRYLNQSTTNYVVSRMVNAFIAKDSDKAYAFEVAFYCQNGGATTGANIKVYKPDFTTQTLVYLGQVSAGTNLRPSDLDTGQVQEQTQACEFEEYFVDVFPEYRVFAFDINSSVPFEADIEAAEEFTVDWGDGSITQYPSGPQTITHTYDISTTYTVTLKSPDKAFLNSIDFVSQSDIFFNISDLPQGIEGVRLFQISNTITGDIRYLPLSLTYFEVYGSNTISGNTQHIANHVFVHFIVSGNNTISGDIRFFPATITVLLVVYGQNQLTGDIFNMVSTPQYMSIAGNNTVSGNIRNLQPETTQMDFVGQNMVRGNIQVLASGVTAAQFQGDSVTTGDIGLTPANLVVLFMLGQGVPTAYTAKAWINGVQIIYLGSGLSNSEIDDLIIDLSAVTWAGDKILNIRGSRTAASDAAVTSLEAQGVTVTVSP